MSDFLYSKSYPIKLQHNGEFSYLRHLLISPLYILIYKVLYRVFYEVFYKASYKVSYKIFYM